MRSYQCWVYEDAPVPVLIEIDNMTSRTDQRTVLSPGPSGACVQFEPANSAVIRVRASSRRPVTPQCFLLQDLSVPALAATAARVYVPRPAGDYLIPSMLVGSHSITSPSIARVDARGIAYVQVKNPSPGNDLALEHSMMRPADGRPLAILATRTLSAEGIKRGTMWGKGDPEDDEANVHAAQSEFLPDDQLDGALWESVDPGVPKRVRRRAHALPVKHRQAFATSDDRVGEIKGHEIAFRMTTDQPIFNRQYPTNKRAAAEAIRQAHQLLEDGVIHRTTSPYNFALVMVAKSPGSSPRMCVDLRSFNHSYVGEWYPIPDIQTILSNVARNKIFSTIDAVQAFHMLKLRSDDGPVPSDHMLAFTLQNGERYAYRRLPFGCKGATFAFSRVLAQIFKGIAGLSTFVDDCAIHTDDYESHLRAIGQTLARCIEHGIKLHPKKSYFLCRQLDFLGHVVQHGQISIDRQKLAAIRDIAVPSNKSELQHALGILVWCRRFVPNFATIAQPLTTLLRKGTGFSWTDREQAAFVELQQAVLNNHTLTCPDFSKPFTI